jgi:hypothetical protein
LRHFGFVLDLCAVNGWLLYRRETADKMMSLKVFWLNIANGMMAAGKRKVGRLSLGENAPPKNKKAIVPAQDVRYGGLDHWPNHGTKGQCRSLVVIIQLGALNAI